MSQPAEIFYCHACGRVATTEHGPGSLLAQGCEGTHQRYVRADLVDQLFEAIYQHEYDLERSETSKDAWSRANRRLHDVRLEIEKALGRAG